MGIPCKRPLCYDNLLHGCNTEAGQQRSHRTFIPGGKDVCNCGPAEGYTLVPVYSSDSWILQLRTMDLRTLPGLTGLPQMSGLYAGALLADFHVILWATSPLSGMIRP